MINLANKFIFLIGISAGFAFVVGVFAILLISLRRKYRQKINELEQMLSDRADIEASKKEIEVNFISKLKKIKTIEEELKYTNTKAKELNDQVSQVKQASEENENVLNDLLSVVRKVELLDADFKVGAFFSEIKKTIQDIFEAKEVYLNLGRPSDIFYSGLSEELKANNEETNLIEKMWNGSRSSIGQKKAFTMESYSFCHIYGHSEALENEYAYGILAVKEPKKIADFEFKLLRIAKILESPLYMIYTFKTSEIVSICAENLVRKYFSSPFEREQSDDIFKSFVSEFKEFVEKSTLTYVKMFYCEHGGVWKMFPKGSEADLSEAGKVFRFIDKYLKNLPAVVNKDLAYANVNHKRVFFQLWKELNVDKKAICWPLISLDHDRFQCVGYFLTEVKNIWKLREGDRGLLYGICRYLDQSLYNYLKMAA